MVYLKDQEKMRCLEYQLSHPNKKSETSIQPAISQSPGQTQQSGNYFRTLSLLFHREICKLFCYQSFKTA